MGKEGGGWMGDRRSSQGCVLWVCAFTCMISILVLGI